METSDDFRRLPEEAGFTRIELELLEQLHRPLEYRNAVSDAIVDGDHCGTYILKPKDDEAFRPFLDESE